MQTLTININIELSVPQYPSDIRGTRREMSPVHRRLSLKLLAYETQHSRSEVNIWKLINFNKVCATPHRAREIAGSILRLGSRNGDDVFVTKLTS